jgi:hypothetical protein
MQCHSRLVSHNSCTTLERSRSSYAARQRIVIHDDIARVVSVLHCVLVANILEPVWKRRFQASGRRLNVERFENITVTAAIASI